MSLDEKNDDFVLTEKDLEELQKMKIETGLSDSTIGSHRDSNAGLKKIAKKKSWFGPPIPKHRDAMGGYKVPTGAKPLSHHDVPTPGPSDYAPDVGVVMKSGPHFTLGERIEPTIRRKREKGVPGPKYDARGDINWKRCKRITIKTSKFVKDKQGLIGPGPGRYGLNRSVSQGPKFSMMKRPTSDKPHGLISALAVIPDPRVPGPDFKPSGCEWLQKPMTFGTKPKDPQRFKAPAPNRYNIRYKDTGPKWHHGAPRSQLKKPKVPGPAAYHLKSSIGDAPNPVICGKYPEKRYEDTPGPDVYNRAGFDLSEPGYTMKYRWFEPDIERPNPGPAAYNVRGKEEGPAYSVKTKTKPTYPSNVYGGLTVEAPSPSQYTLPTTPGPSKSVGLPRKKDKDKRVPGPADYLIEDAQICLPKAPAYTLRDRIPEKKVDKSRPGPANYKVKVQPGSNGRSFGVRVKSRETFKSPGPAQYAPCQKTPCVSCESAEGATLKSRHTPLLHLGLKNSALLPPAPPGSASCF